MKKLLIAAAVIMAAACTQAAYLNWMVDSPAEGYTFNAARLHAVDGSGGDTILNSMVVNANGDWVDSGKNYMAAGVETYSALDGAIASDPSAYSFYIELINYDTSDGSSTFVARSYDDGAYGNLAGHIFTGESMEPSMTTITAWHGGSYAIPEPTSAVLILLGLAGLSLRRRERKTKA